MRSVRIWLTKYGFAAPDLAPLPGLGTLPTESAAKAVEEGAR